MVAERYRVVRSLVGLCLVAACAFAKEPFMMIRFRGPQTDGGPIWEKTAENLARHRAACDEVWFSTGIGVPPLSWHAEQSRRQGAAAAMVGYIRDFALRLGVRRVELNMWEFNRDALAFYTAAGFRTYRRYLEMEIGEETE